jgi:hypothetical protein
VDVSSAIAEDLTCDLDVMCHSWINTRRFQLHFRLDLLLLLSSRRAIGLIVAQALARECTNSAKTRRTTTPFQDGDEEKLQRPEISSERDLTTKYNPR